MITLARAACPDPEEPGLRVGVRPAPPFIMTDAIRGYDGIAIDLWEGIAETLKHRGTIESFHYVECPLGDQLDALAKGKVDVVISPLTITADRSRRFEFSNQYFSSGLALVRPRTDGIDITAAARTVWNTVGRQHALTVIGGFIAFNLLVALVINARLRQHVDADARRGLPKGHRLLRAWIDSVVQTLGLSLYGYKFRTTAMLMLEVVLGIVGATFAAAVWGVVTSALVNAVHVERAKPPTTVFSGRVVTLADSTAARFVEDLSRGKLTDFAAPDGDTPAVTCVPLSEAGPSARCVTVSSWRRAMQVLKRGDADYVLGDWAQLSYLVRQPAFSKAYTIQDSTFRFEPYGWGIAPQRDALRAAVNRELVRRLRSADWRPLVEQHMGEGAISPD